MYGKLTEDQAKTIVHMGFGKILEVEYSTLNMVLCLELVKSLDLDWLIVFVKGDDIRISHRDVGMMFGLLDNDIYSYRLHLYSR